MLDWNRFSAIIEEPSPMPGIKQYLLSNINNCIKLFVGLCPKHFEEGNYQFYDKWIKPFFGSTPEFINSISSVDSKAGAELAQLHVAIANNSEGHVCAPIRFEALSSAFNNTNKD
jgi:hypothetical protein